MGLKQWFLCLAFQSPGANSERLTLCHSRFRFLLNFCSTMLSIYPFVLNLLTMVTGWWLLLQTPCPRNMQGRKKKGEVGGRDEKEPMLSLCKALPFSLRKGFFSGAYLSILLARAVAMTIWNCRRTVVEEVREIQLWEWFLWSQFAVYISRKLRV